MSAAIMGTGHGGQRLSLDRLMARLGEPGFVTRYRRKPSVDGSSNHVNVVLLAQAPPRSKLVRRWRRHARRCPRCAATFRFLGLPLD